MNKSYWTGFLSGTTVVALGLVVLLMGSGFQGASQKIGVVDLGKAANAVTVFKNLDEQSKNFVNERQTVFDFLAQNRIMKRDDMERFKVLSLKSGKTDAEKAELEKIKANALDAQKKFADIQLKPSPSDAELKMLDEYRGRQADSQDYLQRLEQVIRQELNKYQQTQLDTLDNLVSAAVGEVGKKQGYTLVFAKNVAPFGANDVTDEVVKAANK